MTPKTSVIIPVYNLEEYIEEGIKSILNQTFKDIEVIAVNDGSSDNSLDILKSFANKDNRVSVVDLPENRGQSAARNEGFKQASGKYIYYFDGDDILKENALEILFNEAESNDLDIVNFDAETFYHDEKLDFDPNYNRIDKIPDKIFNGKEYFDYLVLNNLLTVSTPLNLIRRNYIIEKNLKFIEGIIHEDEIYITNLYIEARTVKHIDKVLYKRRIRSNSTMTSKKSRYNLISYIKVISELKKVYFKKHKSKSMELKINSIFSSILYSSYDIGLYKAYKDEIKKLFKELKKVLSIKTKIKYRFSRLYYFYINIRRKYNF
jgi:glycosyltransferase involved in cell wall biosynthesis